MIPLEPALVREVLDHALARGGEFAELFFEQRDGTSLVLEEGRIVRTSSGRDRGVGLRVVRGDSTWFANGNSTGRDHLLALADRLAEGVAGSRQARVAPFREEVLEPLAPVGTWPDTVPAGELAERLALADRVARQHDPRVVQVTAVVRTTRRLVLVANSEGRFVVEPTPYVTFNCQVVARQEAEIRSGYRADSATRGWEFLTAEVVEKVAAEAARIACLQLEAAPAPAGTMPVVLSSRAGGTMIHEACGHGLEADFYLKNLSIYSGKLGKKVASERVTVIDDGTLPGRRGSSRVDDEGEPTRRVVLIDRGTLVGLLQSRETARKLGMEPTGNGRRESFRHLPIPRMRNTFIAPGEDAPGEIVASVRDGLFVADMGGGEVDIVSGNFVFHCLEAYRIRDGRIAEPVRDAMLTGNGPAVLESIDMVGSDLGWAVGTCGKDGQGVPVGDAQPTLRIPSLVVGGTGGGGEE